MSAILSTRAWSECVSGCEAPESIVLAGTRLDRERRIDAFFHRLSMGLPRLVLPPPPTTSDMGAYLRCRGYQLQLSNGKGSFWMPPDGGKCLRLKAAYLKERQMEIQGRSR